jgi:hypothetical protein
MWFNVDEMYSNNFHYECWVDFKMKNRPDIRHDDERVESTKAQTTEEK